MSEQEALDALSTHIYRRPIPRTQPGRIPTTVEKTVAFLRDHPDVAQALGIGAAADAHRRVYCHRVTGHPSHLWIFDRDAVRCPGLFEDES